MARKNKSTPASWQNNIIGTDNVSPDQLLAHPINARIHPAAQQAAMQGVLAELGWVQDIIVNKRTGHVLDGHLRVTLALRNEEPTVPVKYVDLDPDEELTILSTFDPVAAMAQVHRDEYTALSKKIKTKDEALKIFLDEQLALHGNKAPETSIHKPTAITTADLPPTPVPETDMRVVQLFFESTVCDDFQVQIKTLAERFDTDTMTDTVMASLDYTYNALKEAAA